MPRILEATRERVLLGGVSWDAYRCLLADAEQHLDWVRAVRAWARRRTPA